MDKREQEEILVTLRESLPRIWMAVYQGSLQAGFTESQAFALLQTYILAQHSGGIHPPKESGPNTDLPPE